jgi:hypothetical protein
MPNVGQHQPGFKTAKKKEAEETAAEKARKERLASKAVLSEVLNIVGTPNDLDYDATLRRTTNVFDNKWRVTLYRKDEGGLHPKESWFLHIGDGKILRSFPPVERLFG